MSGVIANIPKFQFFDSSGAEAVNYKLYTYLAGTLTPATTYQDQALGSANTNPIILDARGECAIWLDSTKSYKFVLQTPAGSTIWTTDNISGGYASVDAVSKTGVETLTNKTITGAIITGGTVEATSGPGDTPFGNRNRIINPNFDINQRAVSGAVTLAAGIYGHDRWKAGAAGCTYTFAAVNGVNTLTITAGSLIQVIEDKNVPAGINNCVLSWTGTAQGKIGAGAYSASGVSASVTGGSNLSIEFGTGTLSKVQFELGSVATPFSVRDYGTELYMCQRYYEKGSARIDSYASAGSQGCGFWMQYKATKRTTGNPVYSYDPGFINVNGASASYNTTIEGFRFTDNSLADGIVRVNGTWIKSDEL